MKTGTELIAAERERQITAEGWTPEHDDSHVLKELVYAAICYASKAAGKPFASVGWPWPSWWKPSRDPVRNLVKAGALIAAEIDRLQRLAAVKGGEGE